MFKICTILKKLISHEEIGKVADRLVKYAGSCAPDSKEALALLIKYIGAEARNTDDTDCNSQVRRA